MLNCTYPEKMNHFQKNACFIITPASKWSEYLVPCYGIRVSILFYVAFGRNDLYPDDRKSLYHNNKKTFYQKSNDNSEVFCPVSICHFSSLFFPNQPNAFL